MSQQDSQNQSINLNSQSFYTNSPPRKRRYISDTNLASSVSTYSPSNTRILRVLRNDIRNKTICLHAKFKDSPHQDAIIILQKSAFPSEVSSLCEAKLGTTYDEGQEDNNKIDFPTWKADEIVTNDIYHRFLIMAGLERTNYVDMTVIHPAEASHFAKYTSSKRQIVLETPDLYHRVILPFLESNPKDLNWVDNILNGISEVERVLLIDEDDNLGFNLVLDYRWDERHLCELHALALARNPNLKCLRDLRAYHLPMLKKMITEGKKQLVSRYKNEENVLREDQIITYFHYPPTFYRLHMHFTHVEGSVDGSTQVGKAILAEDVIANIEIRDEYYALRTMPIYLHDNHPFLIAIRESEKCL